MKLLILGATGGCGRWIVKFAVERGHEIRAIVRKGTSLGVPGQIEVIQASVLNKDVLKQGIDGCDAVVSALGIKRRNAQNPWSQLVSPEDLTTQVAEILVEIMPKMEVRRFVGISAAGVRESLQRVNPLIKWMILHSNMNASYKDLTRMESIFEKSNLDWMAVRPVTLKKGSPSGQVRETEYYGLLDRIKRADVAVWMLNRVEQEDSFLNRTPMIKST